MYHARLMVPLIVIVLLSGNVTQAEVITFDAIVQSVDAKTRTLTVERKGKTRELNVSRKAKVTIDGKPFSLSDLGKGQTVSLSYHDDLEIVLEVESASVNQNSFISLFDGRTLEGWQYQGKGDLENSWTIDSNRKVLVCLGNGANWLETENKYEDFTLIAEWRFLPGKTITASGSGIMVRSLGAHQSGLYPKGIETQIGTGTSGDFWAIDTPLQNKQTKPNEKAVRLFKERKAEKTIGDWNAFEITCVGDRITAKLNGEIVNEGWNAKRVAGRICLLSQKSEVEFRNIRLKPTESTKGETK